MAARSPGAPTACLPAPVPTRAAPLPPAAPGAAAADELKAIREKLEEKYQAVKP